MLRLKKRDAYGWLMKMFNFDDWKILQITQMGDFTNLHWY